jgi:hypothetical protein
MTWCEGYEKVFTPVLDTLDTLDRALGYHEIRARGFRVNGERCPDDRRERCTRLLEESWRALLAFQMPHVG